MRPMTKERPASERGSTAFPHAMALMKNEKHNAGAGHDLRGIHKRDRQTKYTHAGDRCDGEADEQGAEAADRRP